MRLVLFVLAAAITGLWIYAYIYFGMMGCAYVTGNSVGDCGPDMPWQLRGEDLWIFVLIPGAIVLALWALAFRAGRK